MTLSVSCWPPPKSQNSTFVLNPSASRIRSKFDSAKSQIRKSREGPASCAVRALRCDGRSCRTRPRRLPHRDVRRRNCLVGSSRTWKSSPGPNPSSIRGQQEGGQRIHNRTVSGFAHLQGHAPADARLVLYHNDFAELPLDPEKAMRIADAQFVRAKAAESEHRGWHSIYR